jgi:hypothetical protein
MQNLKKTCAMVMFSQKYNEAQVKVYAEITGLV